MILTRLKTIFQTPEKRADSIIAADTGTIVDDTLADLLRGANAEITKEQALNIPAVASSLTFISNIVSSLPIRLYSTDSTGQVKELKEDYRLRLLNAETGDLLDAVQFKKALIIDMLLLGAGYAFINRPRNKIVSLHYVPNSVVSVNKNADPIFKEADYLINGARYADWQIMRILKDSEDGVTGKGALQENPVLFNTMYNSLTYENNTMQRGAKKGFLKTENKLDTTTFEYLKNRWKSFFSSTDTNNDVMVLNKGVDFIPASSTAAEAQLNENKVANTQACYALFGLSEELFVSGSGTTDVFLKAIKTGVRPVVDALVKALNKFLLLEKEKSNLHFGIDIKEILRGDTLTMYKAYELGLKNGFLQLDEVRKQENLPDLGFKFIKLGLDAVLYDPKANTIFVPNTGLKIDLNSQEPISLEKGGKTNDENRIKSG